MSLNVRWTFFHFQSMSSRREDLMDIDMGKKPGDKEYYLAHQLKKKCIKKKFQGIHDRLLLDHDFRARMIENNRDEEVCRRWDVLADEKSHLLSVRKRILLPQEQMVAESQLVGF